MRRSDANDDDPASASSACSAISAASASSTSGAAPVPAAIAFAQQGAIVIALDASDERLAHARARAEHDEVKVEWRKGDLADLAFLRAESIDAAFSADAVAEVDDAARLFRQVQRVLKPNGPFVFSYEHPMALCVGAAGAVERSYFEPGPIDVERDGEAVRVYTRGIGEVFTELGRAGFRVDTVLEPRPDTPRRAACPRPSSGAPARKAPDHSVARCARVPARGTRSLASGSARSAAASPRGRSRSRPRRRGGRRRRPR